MFTDVNEMADVLTEMHDLLKETFITFLAVSLILYFCTRLCWYREPGMSWKKVVGDDI